MNLDARARASAQAIDRSAVRVDPVAGLDDLVRRRRRQPLRRAAAAVALVLLVLVVAVWAGVVRRGPAPVVQPGPGPVTRIRVGPKPVSVALSPGTAWVLNYGNATISRVNPATNRVQQTFAVPFAKAQGDLVFATVADGKLWVVHGTPGARETAISAIDPSSSHTLTTFGFGGDVIQEWLAKPGDVAVGAGAVWVALQGEDQVKRFDVATGELLGTIPLPQPTAMAIDGTTVWVATADGRLRRIDTRTGAVAVRASTPMVTRIRVGQGGVWLMSFDGKLLRLDPRTGRVVAQVPGAFQAADLAVGAEGVWVYDQNQGTVLQVNPDTNRIQRTIQVINRPLVEVHSHVLAVGDGAVWVVDKGGEALVRVDPNG
jgi:DNA-binding beta-propeller fold protein YncE